MTLWSDAIKHARTTAGLDHRALGQMTGIKARRLREIEGGAATTAIELDTIATVFGVELTELASPVIDQAPATLLFRAWPEVQGNLGLFGANNARVLGTFLRSVERLDGLMPSASHLGELGFTSELAALATATERGEELASELRAKLGLEENAPIPSMLQLLEQELGVAVFGVLDEDGDLLPGIDAACTRVPRPAILLNLSLRRSWWWRVRMTLAHELAHLLFDHHAPHGQTLPYLVSPQRRSNLTMDPVLEAIERRANAFAASFLAPRAAVRDCVQPLDDPTCEEAISRIIHTFGVGRSVAINRITDVVLGAQDSRRGSMEKRASQRSMPEWAADVYPTERCGLPGGPLREEVLRQFAAGTLSPVRARQLLDLEPTDWLPSGHGLGDEQRRPLVSREDTLRRRATQVLRERGYGLRVVPAAVQRVADRWDVEIVETVQNGRQERVGFVSLDDGLQLLDVSLAPV